ncbi:MAG: hypothetical protein ACTMHG_10215, partial [Marinobacter sp.]
SVVWLGARRQALGYAFQKFAEPGMAEQKRHKDVPQERFLESVPQGLPSTVYEGWGRNLQ